MKGVFDFFSRNIKRIYICSLVTARLSIINDNLNIDFGVLILVILILLLII